MKNEKVDCKSYFLETHPSIQFITVPPQIEWKVECLRKDLNQHTIFLPFGNKMVLDLGQHQGTEISFYSQLRLHFLDENGNPIYVDSGIPNNYNTWPVSFHRVEIPPTMEKFQISNTAETLGWIHNFEIKEKEVQEFKHQKKKFSSSMILPAFLLLLTGACLLVFRFRKRRSAWVLLISVLFLILTFLGGLPFKGNVGERLNCQCDDESYYTWALTIGRQMIPDISGNDAPASMNNHHSWGTGFLLAPGMWITKFFPLDIRSITRFPPKKILYHSELIALSTMSIFLSYFSILIYFFAFAKVFKNDVAFLISIFTVFGTSLVAWTLDRNFFTHSSEAFLLAWYTLFFIQRYFLKDRRIRGLVYLLLSSIFLMQVRPENAVFTAVPVYFELIDRRNLFSYCRHAIMVIAAIVLGWVLLQASSLFTQLHTFGAMTPSANYFSFTLERIQKNYYGFLFAPGGTGLFKMPFFWLCVLGMLLAKVKLKVLFPYVSFVLFFVILFLFYQFPTGAAWQNRFLLKLNPIFFAGVGLGLQASRFWWQKWGIAGLCVASILYEWILYKERTFGISYLEIYSDYQVFGAMVTDIPTDYSTPLKLLIFSTLLAFGLLFKVPAWKAISGKGQYEQLIAFSFFVYILSPSANFIIVHFFLDINFAKVGGALFIIILTLYHWKDLIRIGSSLKIVVLTVSIWTLYLIYNSLTGQTPAASLRLTLRFLSSWLIAAYIAVLFIRKPNNIKRFFSVFLVCLLLITATWIILYVAQNYVVGSKIELRAVGLFQNPNELAFAVVCHMIVTLWLCIHSFNNKVKLISICFATVAISYLTVYYAQSSNSFLGFTITIFSFLILLSLKFKHLLIKNKYLSFSIIAVFTLIFLSQGLHQRVQKNVQIAFEVLDQGDLNKTGGGREKLANLLGERLTFWEEGYRLWQKNPWTGYGFGSFFHIASNFNQVEAHDQHGLILGTLFEQGIIGFTMFVVFFTVILFEMRSLHGTLLLISFGGLQLFDKLTYSYVFPTYSSIIFGYCFYISLKRKTISNYETLIS